MSVTKLPDPLPKVHQCGCGSQAFHLCVDGRVVCLQCRYIIEGLSVADAQAKSLADERRIAELASLLERFESMETHQHHGRDDRFSTHDPCDLCDLVIEARAALRVETQEEK